MACSLSGGQAEVDQLLHTAFDTNPAPDRSPPAPGPPPVSGVCRVSMRLSRCPLVRSVMQDTL